MRGPRLAVALIVSLVAVARAADEPLQPGAKIARDLPVLEAPREADAAVRLQLGKGIVAIIDLAAKCPVRIDGLARRGVEVVSLFPVGRQLAVLGKQDPRDDRITPYFSVIIGEGIEYAVLPAAREKGGDDVKWFGGPVAKVDAPDRIFVAGGWMRIGRDFPVLVTELHKDGVPGNPTLRREFRKGRPVRLRGTVTSVACTDPKGRPVNAEEARKAGTRVLTEVRVTPSRMALLEASYDYKLVEAAE